MTITLIIVIITCIVSVTAFNNRKVIDDLIFYPPAITYHQQWYRFVTCGLIHADIPHLAFNMISLYSFGEIVEIWFTEIFGPKGKALYIVLYIVALIVCLLPTYAQHKNNEAYSSLGASGAVSAVVFAGIVLMPKLPLRIMFLPIDIPGYIFGIIYLVITGVLAKRGGGGINHSAHLWGGLFGIGFTIVMAYFFSDFRVIENFINQLGLGR